MTKLQVCLIGALAMCAAATGCVSKEKPRLPDDASQEQLLDYAISILQSSDSRLKDFISGPRLDAINAAYDYYKTELNPGVAHEEIRQRLIASFETEDHYVIRISSLLTTEESIFGPPPQGWRRPDPNSALRYRHYANPEFYIWVRKVDSIVDKFERIPF